MEAGAAVLVDRDRRAGDGRHPQRAEQRRQDQVDRDAGAHAVADRETAQEKRGDRRPGKPVGPVEDRPLPVPAGVAVAAPVARTEGAALIDPPAERTADYATD